LIILNNIFLGWRKDLRKIVIVCAFAMVLTACQSSPPLLEQSLLPPEVSGTAFKPSTWQALPDWSTLPLLATWPAFQQSCAALKAKLNWQAICQAAAQVDAMDVGAQRQFYQTWFLPYQLLNSDGSEQGLITGYYEPLLFGSRERSSRFAFPVYSVPADLLEVDLSVSYPALKGMRVRGRLHANKVLPYFTRAEIEAENAPLKGQELFWVDDLLALFFLQVQGSGRIELEDGTQVKIGYADQNGHPYVSIGKKLVEMGELALAQVSMQTIQQWAEKNPQRLADLLKHNPSYVFFRELPNQQTAPLGALGVPLTNEYSLAIDPRHIPLGVPILLSTTLPTNGERLNRLMMAQDTGGAIRGVVRADVFWGFGERAAQLAGLMKQPGKMWVLFPKGSEPR
jgi:membrane-bound lytic murein transglycosylase A